VPYRSIEDPVKLRRVLEATLLIEADLDLPLLLGHVISEAISMTNARYGALGVLNGDRTALVEFITAGLTPEEEGRIGALPTGQGVLGLLISEPEPVRMAMIGDHPKSFGFPPNHPPMSSFLGVPIKVRDEVYGNLYLTDKVGWSEFTSDDEALVGALAVAAGIAIENTRLHQRVQKLAVFDERDRMARDLHDTVIQRLFATGLSLQSIASKVPQELGGRLNGAIVDIDETIRQVRTTIFELGLDGTESGVRAKVISLLDDLRSTIGFPIELLFDGPVDSVVSGQVVEQLIPTIREAVTNIARHAEATWAEVVIDVGNGSCHLQVTDNGRGIDNGDKTGGGLGLTNLRRRAEKLNGDFTVGTPAGGGTVLNWTVPVSLPPFR
jgi:signal transduction histidine kinase